MRQAMTLGLTLIPIMIIIIQVTIGLVLYVLFSFGLYKIAQNYGLENAWLAWIPIICFYLIGKIVGNFKILNFQLNNIEIILPIAFILFIGLKSIPILGILLSGLGLLVLIIALNKLYQLFDEENAFIYSIISAIIPYLAVPIILFIYKDKNLLKKY